MNRPCKAALHLCAAMQFHATCMGRVELRPCAAHAPPMQVCDIIEDIRLMNDQAMKAAPRKTGVIILGGGAREIG